MSEISGILVRTRGVRCNQIMANGKRCDLAHRHDGPCGRYCDCELSHNGLGAVGRICDCDPACTDCDDTGLTFQTERFCTCSQGLWKRGLADGR